MSEPKPEEAASPPKDVPGPSEALQGVKVVGATCPGDETFVTCSGGREDAELAGVCPVCHKIVYADALLVHSRGSYERLKS